jgi:hypothetical protein
MVDTKIFICLCAFNQPFEGDVRRLLVEVPIDEAVSVVLLLLKKGQPGVLERRPTRRILNRINSLLSVDDILFLINIIQ